MDDELSMYMMLGAEPSAEEEAVEEGEPTRHLHYWVLAELMDGNSKVTPVTLQALGALQDIADLSGERIKVAIPTDQDEDALADVTKQLFGAGANSVFLVKHDLLKTYHNEYYTKALAEFFAKWKPNALIIGGTRDGLDLAPRLAARLDTGYISNGNVVEYDDFEGELNVRREVFAGQIFFNVQIPEHRPAIVTLCPDALRTPRLDEHRSGSVEIFEPMLEGADAKIKILETTTEEPTKPALKDAKIIVAGGSGVGSAENFELIKKLAEALGGEVGASRAAVDAGWATEDQLIGTQGVSIHPDLYIACGIHGAIQHLLGIEEAKYIVAINSDANAPIFKAANIGIVGDLKEVIPAFIDEVGR